MRRNVFAVTVLLLAVPMLTTACGAFSSDSDLARSSEVILDAGGSADKVTLKLPTKEEPNGGDSKELVSPELPWHAGRVVLPGTVTLIVTPAKNGVATCRLEVEKKQVDKKMGAPGAPVTCTAKIKDPH
jgi:hypothetical protein